MKSAAKHPELFYLTVLSSFFFFTAVSMQLNFSLAAGAFIGGLALSRTAFSSEALSIIRNIRDLFATIFFVSLGMQLTLFPLGPGFLVFLVMLAVIFILNPIIFAAVNLSEGFGLRVSLFIGLALAQASEFSFILASQGFQLGQISESVYNISIWVIIISMIATPYMINRSDFLHNWLRKNFSPGMIPFFRRRLDELEKLPPAKEPLENHVVIAGAGVFGSTLANEIRAKAPVVIVEQDPELVYQFIQKGFFAVFGSRQNQEVWEKARLEKAKLLIVTIPDKNGAVQLVRFARAKNPRLFIFGRAHYYRDALELYKNGADFVVMPQVIGSNYSLQLIEEFLETGKKPKTAPLEDEYFRLLQEKALLEERHAV
jgi:CPA2 family monovalent cation:H+ antiporter-2